MVQRIGGIVIDSGYQIRIVEKPTRMLLEMARELATPSASAEITADQARQLAADLLSAAERTEKAPRK